jgi:hypothetical protein
MGGTASRAGIVLAVLLVAGLVLADTATAEFGFSTVRFAVTEEPTSQQEAAGELGSPNVQAGSHPWAMTISVAFNTKTNRSNEIVPDGNVRGLSLELPAGMVGDPDAIPRCTTLQFHTAVEGSGLTGTGCPVDSQVGVVELESAVDSGHIVAGLYNLEPPHPGISAELGLSVGGASFVFQASVSADASNLILSLANASQAENLFGAAVTVWGVPADPSHDDLRGACLQSNVIERGAAGEPNEELQELTSRC